MRFIPLTQGKLTIVDDEDYDFLNQWKWSWLKNNWGGYAVRGTRCRKEHRQNMIYMHRFIINTTKGMEVDHVNGNKLDNRKSNLNKKNQ